ncbi:hypothetical protein ANN_08514 [Periplaneta americana]|uniref:DDE-1 domain-containing protein n=1 Tax=Periplaneta americana TaxID=6978 RepID=A0ABQ8T320_PERAM|nr:hypothetical protein ANN_08514 [Periplaneta americana]
MQILTGRKSYTEIVLHNNLNTEEDNFPELTPPQTRSSTPKSQVEDRTLPGQSRHTQNYTSLTPNLRNPQSRQANENKNTKHFQQQTTSEIQHKERDDKCTQYTEMAGNTTSRKTPPSKRENATIAQHTKETGTTSLHKGSYFLKLYCTRFFRFDNYTGYSDAMTRMLCYLDFKTSAKNYNVSFPRRSVKIGNSFIFPEVPDEALVNETEITMILPKPTTCGQTKRQQRYLSFGIIPSNYQRKTDRQLFTLTVRAAAKFVGVHEAMLRKRLKADTVPSSLGRFKSTFFKEEEEALVAHIKILDTKFYGITRKQLMTIVFQYTTQNNIAHPFNKNKKMAGEKWIRNFSEYYVPPALIFPRKRYKPEFCDRTPPDTLGMVSDSGFINSELFMTWLEHFSKHVVPSQQEKKLLILDNHISHCSLAAIEYCREKGIILLSLPPHASHKLQPLDVPFFGH